ncbi:MAG: hypothetical protein ABEH81_09520 [Halopenitus sp.]
MEDRLGRVIRQQLRKAGRQYEEAKQAYSEAQDGAAESDAGSVGDGGADSFDLPTDEDGNARIVCRRYAEKRAVAVEEDGRPACYDPTHPDCEGCVEDIQQGVVETWHE